jgi:superfamily II DNA or RNA helicase
MSTEQMNFDLEQLELPELVFETNFRKFAKIQCVLQSARKISCISANPLRGRRTNLAWEYKTQNNDSYLVTTARKDSTLSGYKGILLKEGDKYSWLNHEDIERFHRQQGPEQAQGISQSWNNQFTYREERQDLNQEGLRPPQIGALHAIAAHWSLSSEAATVVMPTGTGKTETMLSVLVTAKPECMLVVVPSKALRAQTADKLLTLGILPQLGVVPLDIRNPVVGVVEHQIRDSEDLTIFEQCNVIVAVVNSLGGSSTPFITEIAKRCSHLVLDEAHHVAAKSWNRIKEAFAEEGKPILQFTATPFREDRSALGGRIIYNYPLSKAQKDGYFLKIKFDGIFEVDPNAADKRIAEKAISRLRHDLDKNLDHRLLARCQTITRAKEVLTYYEELAPDLKPVMIHSKAGGAEEKISDLIEGRSKIVVSVNMLAEGFNLPCLKVAAIHDPFQSLAVTLQFAGRFPRVGNENLGEPTIIANTGLEQMSKAIEALYDEDADWDQLLSELLFEKVAERLRFEEFNRQCRDMSNGEISEDSIAAQLNAKNVNFRFNTVVYRNALGFNPYGLRNGLENHHRLVRSWEVDEHKTAFFVTRLVEKPRFTKNKRVEDSTLNLYALFYDEDRQLLHIGSSTSSMNCHENLAKAVTGTAVVRIRDEQPYRVFCKIESLMLQQVGLLSGGGARNHRYSMFAGTDVKEAIKRITDGASKSNFFGNGFKDGGPIGIGCSSKGKIWGRDSGSLSEWVDWCNLIADELLDTSNDTTRLIDNVLVPEKIQELPTEIDPWFIEWPEKFTRLNERTLSIESDGRDEPFYRWKLELDEYTPTQNYFSVKVEHSAALFPPSIYKFSLTSEEGIGFQVELIQGNSQTLWIGKKDKNLTDFFVEYPPILSFTDHSSLEGSSFVDPKLIIPSLASEQYEIKDWGDVKIRHESRWKEGVIREDSIQAQAMRWCVEEGFDVVFDDDGSNEIADIVALREEEQGLCLRLMHCKYSAGDDPGARDIDVVEVSSQAVKNVPWMWDLNHLNARMNKREMDRLTQGQTRFFHGDLMTLKKIARISNIRPKYKKEIFIVQPGLSVSGVTPKIGSILGSADSFIRTRLGCGLKVWCSE